MFTHKQTDEISENDVEILNDELGMKRIELSALIAEIKEDDCFWRYVKYWLASRNNLDLEVDAVIKSLKKVIPGDIVFWDERMVETKLEEIALNGIPNDHEHIWENWIVVTEPGIGIEGKRVRTCEECGITQEEGIPPKEDPSIKNKQIEMFLLSLDNKYNNIQQFKNAIKRHLKINKDDLELLKKVFAKHEE